MLQASCHRNELNSSSTTCDCADPGKMCLWASCSVLVQTDCQRTSLTDKLQKASLSAQHGEARFIFLHKSSVSFGPFSAPCRVRCISFTSQLTASCTAVGAKSRELHIKYVRSFSFMFLQHSWVNCCFFLCHWHFNNSLLRGDACFMSGVWCICLSRLGLLAWA